MAVTSSLVPSAHQECNHSHIHTLMVQHQEQFGAQCLAQEQFKVLTVGSGIELQTLQSLDDRLLDHLSHSRPNFCSKMYQLPLSNPFEGTLLYLDLSVYLHVYADL